MKLVPAKNVKGKTRWIGPWADLIDSDSSASEAEELVALGSRDARTSARGEDKKGKGAKSSPKRPQG